MAVPETTPARINTLFRLGYRGPNELAEPLGRSGDLGRQILEKVLGFHVYVCSSIFPAQRLQSARMITDIRVEPNRGPLSSRHAGVHRCLRARRHAGCSDRNGAV